MDEHLIGRSIAVTEAVAKAQIIAVAKVVELGAIDPGAPGQSYCDQTRIEFVRPLRGEAVGTAFISYTFQTFPDSSAEIAPQKGEELIFFLERRKDGSLRAIKTLSATEEHLKQIGAALAKMSR